MADLFEVDGAKCVSCGACVRDCAFRALKMEGGVPRMAFPDRCMKCQHCFAVCPTGAVTFDGKRAADSVLVAGLPLPSLDAVENWLRTRRSMRHFAAEDVDRAALSRILSALGNVPTGCNARALTFTCFPTRASMDGFHLRARTPPRRYDTRAASSAIPTPALTFGSANRDNRLPGGTPPTTKTFPVRFPACRRFGILASDMLRQSFTDFIFATNTDGSDRAASYVRALDMQGMRT